MPFKSRAQRRKFAELLVTGKISPETYEDWNRDTGSKTLPERVSRKRKTRKTTQQRVAKKSRGPARRRAAGKAKKR